MYEMCSERIGLVSVIHALVSRNVLPVVLLMYRLVVLGVPCVSVPISRNAYRLPGCNGDTERGEKFETIAFVTS